MRQLIAAAACAGLLAGCSTEQAAHRQSGAANEGAGAAGIEESMGVGRTGTGTTGAQAGGSGGTRVAGAPDPAVPAAPTDSPAATP